MDEVYAVVTLVDPGSGDLLAVALQGSRPARAGCSLQACPSAAPGTHASCHYAESVLGMGSTFSAGIWAEGRLVGVICLRSPHPRRWEAAVAHLVSGCAREAGYALERASARRQAAELEVARQTDRLKNEFLSIATHELRTPLTTIAGFSELLLRGGLRDDERRTALEWVHQGSQRMAGLVEELLDVSRIESGKLTINLEPVPLAQVVQECIGAVALTAPAHRLSAEIPPDTPEVAADIQKLRQVLLNLLSNAVKYSPHGGQVTVAARQEADAGMVVLAVTDQGMGIPPEEQEDLFTSFHRVRRPETAGIPGTGLGLYIVKGLVEAMGGRVWVESQPGTGSAFFVRLPTWAGTVGR